MNEKEKNSELYSAAVIAKYLQGKLSADEMHAIEKAALDDPFLADAIEGMNQSIESRGSSSLDMDVAELRQRLKQRIANNKNKVVPIAPHRNWLQVAAVFFILIFSGAMTYYYIHNSEMEKKNIAVENNKADQPVKDSPHIAAPAPLANVDSSVTEIVRAKKPAISRRITIPGKNSNATGFAKDTLNAFDDIASEKEQAENKKPEPALVAKDEDKSAGKASRSEYFAPAAKQKSFMGHVTDEHNKPIAAASIEWKNKKIAVTDNNGNFKLNVEKSDSIVEAKVVSSGYIPALADLSNDGSPNIIILREDKSNLQEVVTTGMGKRRKNTSPQQTTQDAMPVQGWDEYNKYLEKNKKPPQDSIGLKGPVVVSFVVNKKGSLSNFAIEQSLGDDYDAEAIRLVKEGPAWKLLKGKKASITVIVTY